MNVRRNPEPRTAHIPRRCGTCKYWEVWGIETQRRVLITICGHPWLGDIPLCRKWAETRSEWGTKCPLWQPIQEEIRRHG